MYGVYHSSEPRQPSAAEIGAPSRGCKPSTRPKAEDGKGLPAEAWIAPIEAANEVMPRQRSAIRHPCLQESILYILLPPKKSPCATSAFKVRKEGRYSLIAAQARDLAVGRLSWRSLQERLAIALGQYYKGARRLSRSKSTAWSCYGLAREQDDMGYIRTAYMSDQLVYLF